MDTVQSMIRRANSVHGMAWHGIALRGDALSVVAVRTGPQCGGT